MFDRIRTAPLLALGALTVFLVGCGGPNLFERLQNPFGGICGLILLVLDVIAIVEVINSSRSTGDKLLWSLLIFFFPFGGLLLYYFIGKK
ncbi:MAG: PLDc_N domain-containing protein [Bacteroidetes bacterium]|nr:PLDc_N domain-containing protein [Bacteroidota bacterium]